MLGEWALSKLILFFKVMDNIRNWQLQHSHEAFCLWNEGGGKGVGNSGC